MQKGKGITHLIVITDSAVFGNGSRTLHHTYSLVIVSSNSQQQERLQKLCNSLVSDFHFCPLAPHLGQILDSLEVDLRSFFENFSSTVQIFFSITFNATFLVKLGKVDIEAVEICSGFPWIYRGQCLSVCLSNLGGLVSFVSTSV